MSPFELKEATQGIEVHEISLADLLSDTDLDNEQVFQVFGLTEYQPFKLVINNPVKKEKNHEFPQNHHGQ